MNQQQQRQLVFGLENFIDPSHSRIEEEEENKKRKEQKAIRLGRPSPDVAAIARLFWQRNLSLSSRVQDREKQKQPTTRMRRGRRREIRVMADG